MYHKYLLKRQDSIERLEFFTLIFLTLFIIYLRLNTEIMKVFINYVYAMEQLSTPELPGTLIRLDYIGFIFPLLVTVAFIIKYVRTKPGVASKWVTLGVVILLCFDLIYSSFYHQLRIIGEHSGSFDIMAAFTVLVYIGYIVWINSYKEGLMKAYIFGFLIGLISDLESIRYLKSTTVFGGGGILDADFMFPLIIQVSFILTFRLQDKKNETRNKKSKP